MERRTPNDFYSTPAGLSSFTKIHYSPLARPATVLRQPLEAGIAPFQPREPDLGLFIAKLKEERSRAVASFRPTTTTVIPSTLVSEKSLYSTASTGDWDKTKSLGPFSRGNNFSATIPPKLDAPKDIGSSTGFIRHVSAPGKWLERNQEPALEFNLTKLKSLDSESKKSVAAEFVRRNQDELWKFDKKFLYKSPEEVHRLLSSSDNFGAIMLKYAEKEKKYKIGTSSHRFKGTSTGLNVPSVVQPPPDSFGSSLTTSRDSRDEMIKALLAPAMREVPTLNKRGVVLDKEWKNFSGYVQCLKENESAMLKR